MADTEIDRGDNVTAAQAAAAAEAAKNADATKAAEAAKAAEADKKKTDEDGKPGESDTDKLGEDENETPEEKAEREKLEAAEEAKRRIRIPKSRFDEAQAKARAREAALVKKIEELENQTRAQNRGTELTKLELKIEELQDKYEDLITEGKKDDARKVRKQVDQLRDELLDAKTTAKTELARRAAVEELKYDHALAGMESRYEVLNPDSENYDADKTDEVADLMGAFVSKGFTRYAALEKAVKYVLGDPDNKKKGSSDETAQALRQKRDEEARKKAAEANSKQPQNPNKAGVDRKNDQDKGGSIDVMRLSQTKFAKLDEETVKSLRGDEVT